MNYIVLPTSGGRLSNLLVRPGPRRRHVGHFRVWRDQGRQELCGRCRRVRDHDRRRRVHCAEQVLKGDIRNLRTTVLRKYILCRQGVGLLRCCATGLQCTVSFFVFNFALRIGSGSFVFSITLYYILPFILPTDIFAACWCVHSVCLQYCHGTTIVRVEMRGQRNHRTRCTEAIRELN